MSRLARFASLFMMLATLSISSLAGTTYVIVNNENHIVNANSVSAYTLDPANGTLSFYGTVKTTGQSLAPGGYYAVSQAITSDAHCLFAIDTESNDIAAFASPTYKLVGKFSNSAVSFNSRTRVGSITVSPNGNFLYGAYTGSQNIGAWLVNADCSLTFIAAYVPSVGADMYSGLGVSPNGSVLVVSAPGFDAAESFTIGSTGSLTDQGFVSFTNLSSCASPACLPAALDFTQDSKIVIFGNSSGPPSVLTASVGGDGTLTNPQFWDLPNSAKLQFGNAVFLSAKAYAGSGFLFVGMSPGVVTATFTESPLSITTTNSAVISTIGGGLASTGDILVVTLVGRGPDIGTFRINSDGSLTPLSAVQEPNGNYNPIWPTIYPNTR